MANNLFIDLFRSSLIFPRTSQCESAVSFCYSNYLNRCPWCLRRVTQGLGICMLLLTIAQPHPTKMPTIGWTSIIPCPQVPPSTPCSPPFTLPWLTHQAIPATIARLVGIGVPSKYLLFPVASLGNAETVTLKRAKRVRPHRTKNESRRESIALRRPRAKAHAAGETPNEICDCEER